MHADNTTTDHNRTIKITGINDPALTELTELTITVHYVDTLGQGRMYQAIALDNVIIPAIVAALNSQPACPPPSDETDQLRVQLAGCLTAAEGGTKNPAKRHQWGWSPAYQAVLDLRLKYEDLLASHR